MDYPSTPIVALGGYAFSNGVPISTPVLYPDFELVGMNGFAFTQANGIVVQSTGPSTDWRQLLSR